MTAIAAIRTDTNVVMAADSAAISGLQLCCRADPKIFCVGPFLIGCSGSYRAMQLLRFSEELGGLVPASDPFRFMVQQCVPLVRKLLTDGGYATIENTTERTDAVFLIAFGTNLFRIEQDFQVAEPADSFTACGCGADLILGSLYSTEEQPDHHLRLRTALEAAERFSAGVRRPWVFCQLSAPKS